MYDQTPPAESAVTPMAKRTLILAILTPFGVIALMASPLVVDAVRQAAGF